MTAGARTADERVEHCDLCGEARVFIRIYAGGDCPDGHGTDCPEWACADCGAAMVIGFDVTVPVEVGTAEVGTGTAARAA